MTNSQSFIKSNVFSIAIPLNKSIEACVVSLRIFIPRSAASDSRQNVY